VAKLKVALSLVTLPNLLLTGLAAAASYIAYIYNKVQAPLDKLKEAQAQMAEIKAQKIFDDKTVSIEIRVENAEPIRKSIQELEDLRKAQADFLKQNESLAANRPSNYSMTVTGNKDLAARYTQYDNTKEAFAQTIKEKAAAIDEAKVAERIKMEAFEAEDAKRQSAIQGTNELNLKQVRAQLKDNKLLLDDKLNLLEVAGREEERVLREQLNTTENLYNQHKLTEQERIAADNTSYEQSFATRKKLIQEKIALEEQAKAAIGVNPDYQSKLLTEDELTILEKYNKAVEEGTVKVKERTVAFGFDAETQKYSVQLAKIDLQQLNEKAAQVEQLTDTIKRAMAIDRQILADKERLKQLEQEEKIRKENLGTAIQGLSEKQQYALDSEKIKYMELTGEINKARAAKRDLELLTISRNGQPESVQTVQRNVVNAAFSQSEVEAATKYHEKLTEIQRSTRDIGLTSTQAFDVINQGFGGLVGTFSSLTESVNSASDALADNATQQQAMWADKTIDTKDKLKLEEAYYKKTIALENEKVRASLTGTRQITSAVANMLEKNTEEYKVAHTIEMALAGAELAMQAMKILGIGAETTANVTSVVPYVGATMTKAEADATAAVASQAKGPPFVAFALMAAMAAAMAALGLMGGKSVVAPGPQGLSPDTGTVLGDSSAKSNSINNVYELLKDIQADNYPVLKSIDQGISNLHSGITDVITRLFQAGGLNNVTAPESKMTGIASNTLLLNVALGGWLGLLAEGLKKLPVIGNIISGIENFVFGGLFGGKQTSSITAQGIATSATPIADVMKGGNLSAQQFAQIQTKTSGGWFGKDKFSSRTVYTELDMATQKALNGVFKSMGTTMFGLADQLGTGLSDRVKNYIIPALTVDLKGLDGEAAAKKLNGVISAALDNMASTVFGDIIGQYQQLGEGMLETAVRIVSEVAVVKDALGKSGLAIAGDVIAISDALVQAAGGLKEFQKAFDNYYQAFYTDAERNVFSQKLLNEQLQEVNLTLPSTRENYRKLIESLNINNAADAERYSLLIKLSSTANEYYKILEAQAEAQAEDTTRILQEQRKLDIQLMELSGDALGALNAQRKDELAAMDASLRFTQKAIYLVTDANTKITKATGEVSKAIGNLTSLVSKLRSTLASTVVSTDAMLAQARISAQNILQTALTTIQAGGSIDNFIGLDQALATIAKPSEQLFTSFESYAYDQAQTGNVIAQLANAAEAQVTQAQQQLDAINGTTTAVLSVKDALAGLATALGVKTATLAAIATANQAIAIEKSTKSTSDTANDKALQSQQTLNSVTAAAKKAADQASAERAYADSLANFAPPPTTWQNGQSGNALWEQILTQYNARHQALYGMPMNRPWTADSEAMTAYAIMVNWYNSLAQQAYQAAAASAASLASIAAAQAALIPGYQATATTDKAAADAAAAAYSAAHTYADATRAAVPGINNFAVGTNYVTEDRWAQIHAGERIMPAADNRVLLQRLSASNDNKSTQELIEEIRELRKIVAKQQKTLDNIDINTKGTSEILDKNTGGGGPMLVEVVTL
jgi:hypothetical protein